MAFDLEQYPELAQWFRRGQTLTVEGQDIFYLEEGDRTQPTLLLIHGFPTSSWDWQWIWASLRRDFRLVALDLLGYGFSAKPNDRRYSIHLQADIVEALIDYLDLDRLHVLAHDYGDTVAQELLARQNEGSGSGSWASCCFLNGGLFPETHQALLTQKILLSPIGPLFNRLVGRSRFASAFSKVFGAATKPTERELDQFWHLINLRGGKHIFHNLITYMNDRLEHRERWVDALMEPICPLAVINGSVDPVSGAHMVRRYQELGCRLDYLAEMAAIGHYPQVEAPDQVVHHYRAFTKTIGQTMMCSPDKGTQA